MKVSKILALFVFLCTLGLNGCGGGAETPSIDADQANETTSTDELKSRLMEVAESGVAGSVLAGMRDSIEASGAANKQELLDLLTQLESEGNPAKVKSLAKQMADKL